MYLADRMKNIKINCFATLLLFISLIWIPLTLKHQFVREKSKSMFFKFLYSIQPVSAKFYRIYPDYFHQTGYFSHRPKSTNSARSLKVWRAKGLGKNYVYIFFSLSNLSFRCTFYFQYFCWYADTIWVSPFFRK